MNIEKKSKCEYLLKESFVKLKSKLPSHLQNEFENTCYFAGGCIYSLWNNQTPKDYDVFCTSKKFIKQLLMYFEQSDEATIITEYAITFGKYQFVTAFIGEPKKVVREFDFMHNMFYFRNGEIHCMSDWSFLDSNKLKFNSKRARDAASTITRVPKFVSRGMEISRQEMSLIMVEATRFPRVFSERKKIKKLSSGKRY